MKQRILAIISAVLGVLLVISLGLLILFGVQLSKTSKVKTQEIAANLATQEKKLKADFQSEKEKTLATYTASDIFGSFSFSYPKVWNTFIQQDTTSKNQLLFLGDPNQIIFDKQVVGEGPYTALRVQVLSGGYSSSVNDAHNKYVKSAKNPFTESDVTVSSISGKKFQGKRQEDGKVFSFVLLPLRDKTLYIGTDDSIKYAANLETILKSFKVSK